MALSALHDALMARLDRLAAAKLAAQLGAVIGRTFTYDLVQAVAPLDAGTLHGALAQLVEAELVAQRGLSPQATYTFKHALIQDAAYQSLLRSTRQQYHLRIAQVMAERFPETTETQPELLAHHYTEAGHAEQAIAYWQQAGQRAVARSANMEAIGHFNKGLEVLKTLPDTFTRAQQELAFQLALGAPFEEEGITLIHQGLAARRVTGAELFKTYVLAQMAEAYRTIGRSEDGLHALREALVLADNNGERFYEAELYRLKGELVLALSVDNQSGAETCFQQALTIARRQQAKSWELRAAMSLSRLWQQQGQCQAAYELLAPVYHWFTEGFDTADLKDAKALLDVLA